ncbi:MAG: glycosyltransferase [Planctomycetota bacterium]|nr:glycosyltransferase [Planctomycetota bacterium]
MTELSVVIPLFNEAARLPQLFDRLEPWLTDEREIVFADDGSTDKSYEICKQFEEKHPRQVQAVRLEANEGKGGAVRAGVMRAKGTYIIFTDADCPYGVDVLDRIQSILATGTKICLGTRDHSDSTMENYGILRRLASATFRLWVRCVSNCGPVRDTQCGVKGFQRETAHFLFEGLVTRDFCFDIELISLAQRLKIQFDFVPVQLQQNAGSSIQLRRDAPRMFLGAWLANRAARARFVDRQKKQ